MALSLYSPFVFLKVIIFAQGPFNFKFQIQGVNFKLHTTCNRAK